MYKMLLILCMTSLMSVHAQEITIFTNSYQDYAESLVIDQIVQDIAIYSTTENINIVYVNDITDEVIAEVNTIALSDYHLDYNIRVNGKLYDICSDEIIQ